MSGNDRWTPPCNKCEQYKVCDSGTHRFFVVVVILMIIASCGYSYLDSQTQLSNIRVRKDKYMEEILKLRVDLAYNTIYDIGRYEGKASELMASHMADDINEAYKDDLHTLHNKFARGIYSDPRFNQIVLKTIEGGHVLMEPDDYKNDGYLIFVRDKILTNTMFKTDRFASNIAEFAEKSYNPYLTTDFIDIIRRHKSETMIIEPRRVIWGAPHKIITNLTYDNIYDLIKSEGLDGVSGYYVVNPAYITRDGDIFNVSDFTDDGELSNNFKITIVPYISLYNHIMKYRKPYLDSITALENLVINRAELDARTVYYSSIKSVIIHLTIIFLILNLSSSLFFRNLIKIGDLDDIKKKLTDRA